MKVRGDGMEILDADWDAIQSGVTSVERDPNRPRTVWVEFGDGSCTSGIRYDDGRFGWDRPEMIEAGTLERVRALFDHDEKGG